MGAYVEGPGGVLLRQALDEDTELRPGCPTPRSLPHEHHGRAAGQPRGYAASFDKGDLPLPPARKVAVLACMDARLNPYGRSGCPRATRT